jgi:hypothetical protein
MDFIERFRPFLSQAHHQRLTNVKTLGLEVGDDLTRVSSGDGVWFDDR